MTRARRRRDEGTVVDILTRRRVCESHRRSEARPRPEWSRNHRHRKRPHHSELRRDAESQEALAIGRRRCLRVTVCVGAIAVVDRRGGELNAFEGVTQITGGFQHDGGVGRCRFQVARQR